MNGWKVVIEYRPDTPTVALGIGALERTYVGVGVEKAIADLMHLAYGEGAEEADILRLTVEPVLVKVDAAQEVIR